MTKTKWSWWMKKCRACNSELWWFWREDLGWFKRCSNDNCPIMVEARKNYNYVKILNPNPIRVPVYIKKSIFSSKKLL